jgi:hypothetical protein
MVVALATLLAMGPARDRANAAEPTSEGDSANGLDRIDTTGGAGWALPREARKTKHEPVSEL